MPHGEKLHPVYGEEPDFIRRGRCDLMAELRDVHCVWPRYPGSRRWESERSFIAMPSTAFSFPVGFSWLSPAYRPSEEEVKSYAEMIAAREGAPSRADEYRSQAELQLWVWRTETHQPPRRCRRGPRIGSLRLFAG